MQGVKCPNCGAALVGDSKFCNYCGAKIPDNVQRSEIRIEDVAALERLKYDRERAEEVARLERQRAEEKLKEKKRQRAMIPVRIIVPLLVILAGYLLRNVSKDYGWFISAVLYMVGGFGEFAVLLDLFGKIIGSGNKK